MTTIQIEPWTPALRAELQPLLEQHYQELATDKGRMTLDPDWEVYRVLYDGKAFYPLIARRDGELVGYHGIIIEQNLHYRSLRMGVSDVLWIRPDLRTGPLSGRLLLKSQEVAREQGATVFLWRSKPGTALNSVLSRRYRQQDVTYLQPL